MFLAKNDRSIPQCPVCHADMFYRDSRNRISKSGGGKIQWLKIRRFRCRFCNKLHTELPISLIPHKHYRADIIMGVIDRKITPDIREYEDYPCCATMQHWISEARKLREK